MFSDPFLSGGPTASAWCARHRGSMRRPRLDLPGIPQHITHRGVNRGANFIHDKDFAAYLQAVERVSGEQGVSIGGKRGRRELSTPNSLRPPFGPILTAVSRAMCAKGGLGKV